MYLPWDCPECGGTGYLEGLGCRIKCPCGQKPPECEYCGGNGYIRDGFGIANKCEGCGGEGVTAYLTKRKMGF